MYMFWAPPAQLLLWLATVFLAKGLMISLCRQFLRTPREDANPHAWRTRLMAAEFLYGLSWAAVAFVSAGNAGEAAHTFVFAALLIVISMRMLFAAPVMPIVYAGTLPMAAAIVLRFALLDNPYYWAMAVMALYAVWDTNTSDPSTSRSACASPRATLAVNPGGMTTPACARPSSMVRMASASSGT